MTSFRVEPFTPRALSMSFYHAAYRDLFVRGKFEYHVLADANGVPQLLSSETVCQLFEPNHSRAEFSDSLKQRMGHSLFSELPLSTHLISPQSMSLNSPYRGFRAAIHTSSFSQLEQRHI